MGRETPSIDFQINLTGLQQDLLQQEELASEGWYVPIAQALVSEALGKRSSQTPKLLDVGCGNGRTAFTYALDLDCSVVGIDINETAIGMARGTIDEEVGMFLDKDLEKKFRALEPIFLIADITKEGTAEDILKRELGQFDVATFMGVFGSLIKEKEIQSALQNTRRLLKPKGKIVISDFGWWQAKVSSDHYWERRYDRDQAALLLCGEQEDCLGTVVIHPFGLSDSESLSLSPEQVAEAIQKKKFERLVRHWRVSQIKDFLQKGGFAVLKEKERVRCWNPEKLLDSVIDGSELEERKFLLNYQILAQMTG